MKKTNPTVIVIGGTNGAGKTTSALRILPAYLNCVEFVNADAIATALSPFNPKASALEAGRLMLERLRLMASRKVSFAFESTLASRSFHNFLRGCKKQGYDIHIIYLWLRSVNLAEKRIRERVRAGGHDIPPEVISRRYKRGLDNFFTLYLPLADHWQFFDNSGTEPVLLAKGEKGLREIVRDEKLWSFIKFGE